MRSISCELSGFPRSHSGGESACQCRRRGFSPWVWKIPWKRKWQPTPVLVSGKFHGQQSLVGYSSWGLQESDMTDWTLTLTRPSYQFGRGTETAGKRAGHSHSKSEWPQEMTNWLELTRSKEGDAPTSDTPMETMRVSTPTVREQKAGRDPVPGNPHPFPKTAGIIVPLTSLWNYPAHKN